MGEPTFEFNEWDSDSALNPDVQSIEEELIGLDLNPDSDDQFTDEPMASDSDSEWTREITVSNLNSDHEHELPVPPTGWGWDPEDDEYQSPAPSGHEYRLPIPPSGWDWDPNDEYQPRSLCFQRVCRCLSFSKYKNPNLERGDKIIMPPSYLREIVSLGLQFPLFFNIENISSNITSHCGVLEFDGTEGFIFVPEWMMNNLKLKEGDYLIIRNALLSPGRYIKLQPHATAFTQISDPKAVLEKTLRDFTCLSRGDTFMIRYNEREFYFDVLDVAPANAISLIETDCEVEFAPPLDYKEPDPEPHPEPEPMEVGKKEEEGKEFRPFMGRARRIDGNPVAVRPAVSEERKMSTVEDDGKEAGKEKFKPFTGGSYTLGSS
ncbi:Ubiquitin fusion-degradation protein [Handroanthus impetiginosus]|uniref:Ubiquitin fusion-degradation protein n=1 Tax=Handroanthus impetiginosus TaxID=429701 RepID=A0A2G9I2K5_9LAMI|nr:Ubiquitin fusion-degradation protein [Handroanthus impetiginosus]